MSCFCKNQAYPPDHYYLVKDLDGTEIEYQICSGFVHQWWRIWESSYYASSFCIVIWNLILRFIYKTLIKGIRYTSKSVENTAIMLCLFEAFVANYGLIFLLAPTTQSYAQITDPG